MDFLSPLLSASRQTASMPKTAFFLAAAKLSENRIEEDPCNKDTGTLTQLRGHSRGILPMISGNVNCFLFYINI